MIGSGLVKSTIYAFMVFRGIEIPIMKFRIRYSLMEFLNGEVPIAEVYLPIGKQLPFGNLSPSYSLLMSEFQEYAIIYVAAKNLLISPPFGQFSSGIVPIFIGTPVSVSYEVVMGTAYYKVILMHWIFILEQTSLISSLTSPESILDTRFLANISLCGFNSAPFAAMDRKGAAAIISTFALTNFLNTANIWSILGPMYLMLSNCHLDRASVAMAAAVAYSNLNHPALKILNAAFTRDLTLALYSFISFLFIKNLNVFLLLGIIKDLVLNEERDPIFVRSFLESENHSILRHLLFVAKRYQFHVSPLINYIALMPMNFSVFSVYNITGRPYTIMNSDVIGLSKRRTLKRALRGIITYLNTKTPGISLGENTQSVMFGGSYIGLPVGMLRTVMAPSFINIAASASLSGGPELGLADVHPYVGTMWSSIVQDFNKKNKRVKFDFRSILTEYSRFFYVNELNLSRTISLRVAGIRLDNSCGSNISIQEVGDGFPLIGTITSITYYYSAISDKDSYGVMTEYELHAVRGIHEFFDPQGELPYNPVFTAPEHYLYEPSLTPPGLPMILP